MGVYNPKKKIPTSCYMCWDSLYCEYKIKNPAKMAQGRADDCPLIEIVRCGECKWWVSAEESNFKGYCSKQIDAFNLFDETDFCSYGERKEK